MSQAELTAVNQPGQKPVIPPDIEKAMRAKGIKTLNMLATKCGYSAMTIRRLFLPTHGHKMLFQYLKWCLSLRLSMEDFFSICLDNEPDEAGIKLNELITSKGYSLTKFSAELGKTSGVSDNIYRYINGEADYQAMRIYRSISTTLGITADKLAISFATTFRGLHTPSEGVRVLESGATTSKSIKEVLTYKG